MKRLTHITLWLLVAFTLNACAAPAPKATFQAYKPPKTEEKIVYVSDDAEKGPTVAEESEKVIRSTYKFRDNPAKRYNTYALVIGVTQYQNATAVNYADYSAYAFKELALKTLGIPKENILFLVNESATSGQIKSKIELLRELAEKDSRIYVYFAGHGVPGKDGNAYLLPADMSADAIHLEPGLRLTEIYGRLAKSRASNVYFIVDSCFSGKDDSGKLVYKGVAPVLRTKKTMVPRKLTVLSAGSSSEFANDLESKRQRMFTYYLIKSLEGGEKQIDSLFPQVRAKVKRASLRKGIGYKQVPELAGNTRVPLY